MRDDFDSVVADRFKVLDDVPVPETWSRVQFKVLDHMPHPDNWSPVQFTEEVVVTMIDVKTTDPTVPRQKRPMRPVVAGILAAAAVVAIIFVATSDVDVVTPADEPSTTVTVPPTPPLALPNMPPGEQFVPGTYFVDEIPEGTPTARILFTIGDGWSDVSDNEDNTGPPGGRGSISSTRGLWQEDIGAITFSRPGQVFSDACHWSDGYHPGPVATLDGFVAALSEQEGWADVTAPSDISVDGYAGKAFQRTAPAEILDCTTTYRNPRIPPTGGGPIPVLRSWVPEIGLPGEGGEIYEPGEVETLWVLDIDGTVVVINTRLYPSVTTGARALAGPSAAARADFAAVLDSIRIERG